jgi:hypothetical protein
MACYQVVACGLERAIVHAACEFAAKLTPNFFFLSEYCSSCPARLFPCYSLQEGAALACAGLLYRKDI